MKLISTLLFISALIAMLIVGIVVSTSQPWLSVQAAASAHPLRLQSGHMPAIQPRAAEVRANILPTFTIRDVQRYLQMHPFDGHTTSGEQPAYTIMFLSAQALENRLHMDFSSDAPVLCYVEFQGPLVLNHGITSVAEKSPVYAYGYEVFDGWTGDLIVWGAEWH
jgi:hypothetical protein